MLLVSSKLRLMPKSSGAPPIGVPRPAARLRVSARRWLRGLLVAGSGVAALAAGATRLVADGANPVTPAEPRHGLTLPAAGPALNDAARVADMLARNCAQCHAPTGAAAMSALVLTGRPVDPATLSGDRRLIVPGNPDASRLFTEPLFGWGSHGFLAGTQQGLADARALELQDVLAMRRWIDGLRPHASRPCVSRAGEARQSLESTIVGLRQLTPVERERTRLITISPHLGDCTGTGGVARWRAGVRRALASVSRAPGPIVVRSLGHRGAVLAVDLESLGWSESEWSVLAGDGGELSLPAAAPLRSLRRMTASQWPLISARRLVARLYEPEVYRRLVDIPADLAVLLSNLRIDLGSDAGRKAVRRMVVPRSAVTGGPRLIERYETPRGDVWLAHRLDNADAHGALTNDPMGGVGRGRLVGSATRGLLPLPNGLPAFFAGRLPLSADEAAPSAVPLPTGGPAANGSQPAAVAESPRSPAVVATRREHDETEPSLACAGCHGAGPVNGSGTSSVPAAPVDPIVSAQAKAMAAYFEEGRRDVAHALQRQGLAEPAGEGRSGGVDPVVELARLWHRPIGLAEAAIETRLPEHELRRRLSGLGPAGRIALAELLAGIARREELRETLRTEAVAPMAVTDGASSAMTADAAKQSTAPHGAVPIVRGARRVRLRLALDKEHYEVGDLVRLHVTADTACHLVVISVANDRRATVLLPNDFDNAAFLPAGQVGVVPAPAAAYRFRLGTPGRERMIVVCNGSPAGADGIRHDFEKQKFSELGLLERIMTRIWTGEPVTIADYLATTSRSGSRQRDGTSKRVLGSGGLAPLAWTGAVIDVAPRASPGGGAIVPR